MQWGQFFFDEKKDSDRSTIGFAANLNQALEDEPSVLQLIDKELPAEERENPSLQSLKKIKSRLEKLGFTLSLDELVAGAASSVARKIPLFESDSLDKASDWLVNPTNLDSQYLLAIRFQTMQLGIFKPGTVFIVNTDKCSPGGEIQAYFQKESIKQHVFLKGFYQKNKLMKHFNYADNGEHLGNVVYIQGAIF